MRFSARSHSLPASPIRRLEPFAEEARARGIRIYPLHIGQPDIETPGQFSEAVKKFSHKTLAYGTSQGDFGLIDKIVEYYGNYGIPLERKDILVTNGGSEALNFAVQIVCDPGDEMLVPEPFFPAYAAFAASASARIIPVTTRAEDGFHLPSRSGIEKLISPATRAILLSHPGNPTGVVYSREEIETLADLTVKHDLLLIADEVYREFVYMDELYCSFGNIERIRDRLVIIDSVSKRYSACGARIGCLISRNPEFISLGLKYCQARGCPPTLEQLGAAALYETPDPYLKEVNREYRKRRDILFDGLSGIPGVVCKKPEGAFYIMAKLPVDDAEKFIIWMLQEFSVNGETVMTSPAEGFYATPGLGKTEIRMAYVLNEGDLKNAVKILAKGISAYPGKTLWPE
ncbi:MAG: pyridoxal phosphate-dependent aminotransferase [Thermovirgaceae bacterium]|nr:pyridoxal phosphate-dependent aminotransferase [Thermovirgaceae bacterium]